MKFIYSTLLKFALESFGNNEEESIKEKVAQKIIDDSKDLIFAVTAINISLILFITSFMIAAYTIMLKLNFSSVEIFSYLSLTALLISFLIAFIFYKVVKKKTKIYRDISTVKRNVTNTTIFEPLIKQMKSEQVRMRYKVKNIEYENSLPNTEH